MPVQSRGRSEVSLRPLRESDCELLFRWRNDPWIVSLGSLNRRVSADEHNAWFERAIVGNDIRVFIIQTDDEDIGQIRFVRGQDSCWEVSIYLMKDHTGRGYGVEAIRAACNAFAQKDPTAIFVAHTLADNTASQSAFRKAGFGTTNDEEAKQNHIKFTAPASRFKDDSSSDDERNIALYTSLLERHGLGPQALNWGSARSQERRFEVISEIGDLHGQRLLDVGCGTGDLYAWLAHRRLGVNYSGIDITPAMIEAARQRFPGVQFAIGDIRQQSYAPESFDYVVASGIFAKRKLGQSYLEVTVQSMFSACKKGVAFNSLCSWATDQDEDEYYADPEKVFEFCKTLTRESSLRTDYHPRDFTIYLYKNRT